MPPRKRQKTGFSIGMPSEADLPSARTNNLSSFASSTRILPFTSTPPLVNLCMHVFVDHIRELARNEAVWNITRQYLKILPEAILTKIFALLRIKCPTVLNAAFMTAYFFCGPVMTLDSSMPGVHKSTIADIQKMGAGLRSLELTGFEKFPDTLFASLLQRLPSLKVLVLRGCSQVGAKTIAIVAEHCKSLQVLNLNYTAVTPLSLLPVVLACSEQLEVLKVAGISSWTDVAFGKFLAGIDEDFRLPALRTLKLRGTSLTDPSVNSFLALCPNLMRLDLAFLAIKSPPFLSSANPPPLEKLSLTSTKINNLSQLRIIDSMTNLKILSLGAMGSGQALSAVGSSYTTTMTDEDLFLLTDLLKACHLEDINLAGNTKLGLARQNRALAAFVSEVGRKCKKLKLAGITNLRSLDLVGLLPEDDEVSPLEVININNTSVGNEAAAFIASCIHLKTLEVAGTKFDNEGLFTILDSCTELENLDLTSCRGVGVSDRRRFFEVWKEHREE